MRADNTQQANAVNKLPTFSVMYSIWCYGMLIIAWSANPIAYRSRKNNARQF